MTDPISRNESSPAGTNRRRKKKDISEKLNYDNLFKTVMKKYFWDALKIFSPALYADANTNRKPRFMEQELEQITFKEKGGAKRVDLLVQISMKSGEKRCLLCHLEIQGGGGGNLPARMDRYRSLIALKHNVEPVAIAVLTEPRPKNEPMFYSSEQYETQLVYKYKNIDVRKLDDEMLLSGDNRIALILYAAKRAQDSKNDESRKFKYLRDISNIWAERGWSNDDKRVIMLAIEYLINLKDLDYTKQMAKHFESLETEGKIVYKTIAERVYGKAFKKAYKAEGLAEGKAEGRAEGKLEVAIKMLKDGLAIEDVVRYTDLPRSVIEAAL